MSNKTRIVTLVVAIVVMLVIAFFAYDGLVYKSGINYAQSISANPKRIEIIVKDKDFEKIKEQRAKSIDKGTIINEEGSYVPGKFVYKGDTIKIELRLKGHMLDHVKGEKWSYRIKVKKGKDFLGLKRFTIQHPGTRQYASEWVYHKLMEQEGVIALKYDFVNLTFNGKDLGIFAVEEHFAQELAERNNRPNGPFIRFNPENYWEGRHTRDLEKIKVEEDYSTYQASYPEFYDRKNTLEDSTLLSSFLEAQNKLEQFKHGEVSTSQIFDVNLMAKFHAVIDLVGGHHSLDWSDVKYYYNPKTHLLEPVAYESFTLFDVKKLSGSYNFVKEKSSVFHQQLFSDSIFFKGYINELQRISQPQYLDTFFSSVDKELKKKLSIIYSEFPYKDFSKQTYYHNQKAIRKLLNEKKPLNVFLQEKNLSDTTITLSIGTLSGLPYEVISLSCGSEKVNPTKLLIYGKQPKDDVNYFEYKVKVSIPFIEKLEKGKGLSIYVNILGSENSKEIMVNPYPYTYKSKNKNE